MTPPDAADHHDPRPRRRWRWWHSLLLIVTLLVLTFVLWRVALDRRLEAAQNAIRAEGLPATPAELDIWYEHVPDAENAALVWLDAAAMILAPSDPAVRSRLPYIADGEPPLDPWQPYPSDQAEAMENSISLYVAALARTRDAAGLIRSRYPNNYALSTPEIVNTATTFLSPIRRTSRLLAVHADHATTRGDGPRAAESIRASLALADSLDHDPLTISQLTRLSTQELSARVLERAVNHLELDGRELRLLDESLRRTRRIEPFRTAIIGERVMSSFTAYASMAPPPGIAPPAPSPSDSLANMFWQASGIMELNDLTGLEYYGRLLGVLDLPLHERTIKLQALEREVEQLGWTGMMVRITMPSLSRQHEVDSRVMALLVCAHSAVAVERYRLAHDSQPPDTLDQLVPDYLDAVPVDPFDGKPLRYVKTAASHYKVYSVGEDLTDDGGTRRDAAGDEYTPSTDIVFEVRRAGPTPSATPTAPDPVVAPAPTPSP